MAGAEIRIRSEELVELARKFAAEKYGISPEMIRAGRARFRVNKKRGDFNIVIQLDDDDVDSVKKEERSPQ